jgi:hypothetical protein
MMQKVGVTRTALCSMHVLQRVCSKAANPSSHAMMAPSLLSSSLSQAKSYSYSSSINASIAVVPGEEDLHTPASDNQCHNEKQAQNIAGAGQNPTYLTMRFDWGQRPSSLVEMVAVDHHQRRGRALPLC